MKKTTTKNNIRNRNLLLLGALLLGVYLLYLLLALNPSVIPEAGYCLEKGLETSYTTVTHLNGTKEAIEYCRLPTFCDSYETSTIISGEENFDQQKLNSFVTEEESKGLDCFQDYAVHTQRNTPKLTSSFDVLETKFACCTQLNLEDSHCPGNTCDGRYTGFIDTNGCRIYAVEKGFNDEGELLVATCGGDMNSISS